jgi:hypothetical protein
MFRALLAHPQDALHKRHLVYCVRVMSVGCTRIEAEVYELVCTPILPILYVSVSPQHNHIHTCYFVSTSSLTVSDILNTGLKIFAEVSFGFLGHVTCYE